MKPIFTLDAMKRANAEVWEKEAARRSKQLKRIDEHPSTSLVAIKTLGDLCRELDGSFHFKQQARAERKRTTQPNPIHLFIIRRLKRNRDSSDNEILINEVENNSTGDIQLSPDKKSFVATGENGRCFRLAVTSLSPIISRLRRKIV